MHHNRRRKWINQQREIARAIADVQMRPQPFTDSPLAALRRYFQVSTASDNYENVQTLLTALKLATKK
jgi:hypothetical protein